MAEIPDRKLAAETAGNKIYEAIHEIAKLIEDSPTKEEAFALWDALLTGLTTLAPGIAFA